MTAPMPETMSPREKVAEIVEAAILRHLPSAVISDTLEDASDILAALASSGDQLSKNVGELKSGSGDHAELARLAEAATPGPWFETEGHPSGRTYGIHAEAGPVVAFRGIAKPHGQGEHNAAFIAAANPATVLALLAEVAALRADGEVYQNQADHEFRLRKEAERKLAEAVGLLKRTARYDHNRLDEFNSLVLSIRTFLNKEAERG